MAIETEKRVAGLNGATVCSWSTGLLSLSLSLQPYFRKYSNLNETGESDRQCHLLRYFSSVNSFQSPCTLAVLRLRKVYNFKPSGFDSPVELPSDPLEVGYLRLRVRQNEMAKHGGTKRRIFCLPIRYSLTQVLELDGPLGLLNSYPIFLINLTWVISISRI